MCDHLSPPLSVAPQVTIAANTTAIQGNSLTLDCNVIGQPRATVVWTRGNDGSPVPLQGRITQDTDGRLFFSTIFSTDEAVYNCTATNSIGAATAETYLTVLVVPVIQVSSVVVVVLEGETAVLGCLATGTPTPEVTWFRDSVPLPNPALPHIQLASNNSLVVGGALRGDAGVYICRASNRAGTESATVQLRVNGEIEGECLSEFCYVCTVEPPNKGHLGTRASVLYSGVLYSERPLSEVPLYVHAIIIRS